MSAITQPWTFDTAREALRLRQAGAPFVAIARVTGISTARVKALVSAPLKCTACGTRDARRDVPYCSYCLYAD